MNLKYFHNVSATALVIANKDDQQSNLSVMCFTCIKFLIVGTKQACFLTKSVRYDGMPESVRQLIDKFEAPDEVNRL